MVTIVEVLQIVAGGLSAVVLGMVWYSPRVFGGAWMGLVNLSPAQIESAKKKMPIMALVGLLAAFVLSWVMLQLALALSVTNVLGALTLGFLIWFGCMVPVLLAPVLWEQKELKYFAITAGYWLLTTISIASIVTLNV